VYAIEIEQGGYLSAEAHPEGTQEFLTVFMGELTVQVEDQEYRVGMGDAIRFRADKPHAYHNSGEGLAKISLVIHYTL
jgi:quercetin dioxygenase-like cupin family protein